MTDNAAATEQLDTYFKVVHSQCVARGLVAAQLDDASRGHIGVKLQGATRSWDLYVDCGETLLKLPNLSLGPPRELLPHVSYGGTICVNDGQGLSIDPDRHADIVAYTVLAGYDLLEKWSTDETSRMVEFFNELEGYWSGLPGALRGRAAFEVDDKDRLITAYADNARNPARWFFTERETAAPSEFNVGKLGAQRALYVHLDELPLPPASPEKLQTTFIEAVHAKFSPAQLELWSKLVGPSKNGSKQLTLLVSVPRQAGGRSLVGVVFTANRAAIDWRMSVIPLTVRRHTPSYMRERGGASLELLGKHVAVLGCGAIGAVVADSLAAAGVGKLTLVDHDEFSEDNVFRHVLEPMYIGLEKTHGLKFQLTRKYPGLQVTSVPTTAQEWIKNPNLDSLDGIVLAFGAPSVERSFSRYFRGKSKALPIVFTWLEALDLGGHSVLTWSNSEGCLDCLYRDEEGQPSLDPRTSFLAPDQHVTRNLTGCASIFVPFGALQARRTGVMAAEHILSAVSGTGKTSYRFLVGEGTTAQAQGLKTTNWWNDAVETSQAEATLRAFGRPCKRCRGAA